MKKILFGTSALIGVGLVAGQAVAADGIKLTVGGFFRTAYILNFDENDDVGDAGHNRNIDGVHSDAEIHFKGETTLDNGVTVGVRVELEGEQAGDQIDEAYTYFKGGFGELRIGSDDEALANSCVTPPGSTANFGAFSPNEVGAAYTAALGISHSNTVCTGVEGDAQKILYFSPTFAGFALSLSYTPKADVEGYDTNGGPHIGEDVQAPGDRSHDFSAYLTYTYEGDGWGVNWGGGASFTGRVEGPVLQREADREAAVHNYTGADAYQTALNLTFGNLKVGGAFQYYDANFDEAETWIAGGGISYALDQWTVGFQYSHQSAGYAQVDATTIQTNLDRTVDRFAITGIYNMGPGIDIEAQLAYTTTGINDNRQSGPNAVGSQTNPGSDYDAFEIGIGTAITF